MNEDVIADLKQFITATVSQQTSTVQADITSLRSEMNQRFDEADQRFKNVDERFDDLEAKVDAIADAQATDITDHEQRITKLEQQAA